MFLRHIWMLAFRILLLIAAFFLYFNDKEKLDFTNMQTLGKNGWFLFIIWVMLAVGMLHRIIPNRQIAIGARKHYACSFSDKPSEGQHSPTERTDWKQLHKGAFSSATAYVVIIAAFFLILFLHNALTPAAVMLLVLVYAVADVAFILFFCPLRALFMRNHCCTVCRIYNWDYIMICAPMILFPHIYSVSLLLLSVAVLLRWERAIQKTPHFFMAETNENLRCSQCESRLCLLQKSSLGLEMNKIHIK